MNRKTQRFRWWMASSLSIFHYRLKCGQEFQFSCHGLFAHFIWLYVIFILFCLVINELWNTHVTNISHKTNKQTKSHMTFKCQCTLYGSQIKCRKNQRSGYSILKCLCMDLILAQAHKCFFEKLVS